MSEWWDQASHKYDRGGGLNPSTDSNARVARLSLPFFGSACAPSHRALSPHRTILPTHIPEPAVMSCSGTMLGGWSAPGADEACLRTAAAAASPAEMPSAENGGEGEREKEVGGSDGMAPGGGGEEGRLSLGGWCVEESSRVCSASTEKREGLMDGMGRWRLRRVGRSVVVVDGVDLSTERQTGEGSEPPTSESSSLCVSLLSLA